MDEEIKLDEKEVLGQVADAVLQEPLKIEVECRPNSRAQKLLQRFRILPVKKVFEVRPLTLGTLIRISKLLLEINPEMLKNDKWLESGYELIKGHGESVATIIALAVTNSRNKPAKSLVQFFVYNLTASELLSVLFAVMKQMDVRSFFFGLVLTRGLGVLESKTASVTSAETES